MPDLSSRRILVTGAAAGIGLATSGRLLRAGAAVLMCDKNAEALRSAAAELGSAGVKVRAIVADVTDAAEIERVAEDVGVLDGLVNCAGIYPVTTALELKAEEWDRVAHAVSPHYGRRPPDDRCGPRGLNRERLVDGQRIGATRHRPLRRLESRAQSAHPRARRRIRAASNLVNAVLPGVIATETVMQSLADPAAQAEVQAKEARIPMGRLGEPHEIAELVVILLSDASSYSTGGLFTADRGYSLGISRYT